MTSRSESQASGRLGAASQRRPPWDFAVRLGLGIAAWWIVAYFVSDALEKHVFSFVWALPILCGAALWRGTRRGGDGG